VTGETRVRWLDMVTISFFAAANLDPLYVWNQATLEGKIIILILAVGSIFSWSVMLAKWLQMRQARKLNGFFEAEYQRSDRALAIYDRRVQVEGCPLFSVYIAGSMELDGRLKSKDGGERRATLSIKSVEHVKRSLENSVARESLKLESGLITLALAVSGAPFLGLLGTVWGVMSAFSYVAQSGKADLATMAPGVAASLATTVAGLLVAIPSMFGYNWLVHNLRVLMVELDNFAQSFVSRIETEYLSDE
jgi:biopolymer transport protein TolQ